jgi:predicted nucleic acid-binding protein
MIYADSTFMVALTVPHDTHHAAALRYYEAKQEEVWLWSPWHRVEVFNTLRQLTRHPDARFRITPRQAQLLSKELDDDVRAGYFTHMEADWRDVLRTANEISAAHGYRQAIRSADLLHVAYASELSARAFVGFDTDQLALAEAAGLTIARPA